LRYGSAIHRRIPLPNYDTHPHRLQFDDFVVRLRIEFGGTDEIDVIADRLTMAKKRVADVLVDTLIAAGVKPVSDRSALVGVLVHGQELSMPPTITFEQAAGFGVSMVKAVLSGRGDELVNLAKVNLFR
jgi:hypothetical protein